MYIQQRANSSWMDVFIDGKVEAISIDLDSAIHAMWVVMGSDRAYTLMYEPDTGIVHKRMKDLPKQY